MRRMNSKRALQGSFWLYAALYVFFFILWRLVVNAANWNMYIQCGVFKDETASVDRHRKLLDGSNKPLFQDQSPGAPTRSTVSHACLSAPVVHWSAALSV